MTRPDFIRSRLSEAEVNALREDLEAAQRRIRELEDGLRPFAFEGMTWLHGNKVMIKIDTAAIERARSLTERNSK